MIDLRSDTVTKPTKEMREEIKDAKVGDDVYGEDPTVNKLEKIACELFDKQDAIFVPSGTMGNQIAINVHTSPSEEVILDHESHIYNYEMASVSSISGIMPRAIGTEKKYLPLKKVKNAIQPDKYYLSDTGLLTIENTHNARGGIVYPLDKAKKLKEVVKEKNIPLHIDGARIFNASIVTRKEVSKLTEFADSVMFCLSKGLGAPIGSMLVGNYNFIEEAKKVRKKLGGGMRQVGLMAKAGIYALKNHVERLEEDHKKAKKLAQLLDKSNKIEVKEPETNILLFKIKKDDLKKDFFIKKLKQKQVLLDFIGSNKLFRAVTHLGIDQSDIRKASMKIRDSI